VATMAALAGIKMICIAGSIDIVASVARTKAKLTGYSYV
jgi:hypothetical protein